MLTPKRIYVEELLDAGEGTDDDVAENLSDIRRINRFFGGRHAFMRAVASGVGDLSGFSLLDVGTGSADIPSLIMETFSKQQEPPTICALDISERNIRVSRLRLGMAGGLNLVRGDARSLPFQDGSFDIVTASLFLHHFRDEDVVALLAEFARVAARLVIVNDLTRNLIPYYFIKLFGPLFTKSFLTRYDGPVSILRGFTRSELADLVKLAGIDRFRVERIFPYRLLLTADVSRKPIAVTA